MAIGLQNLYDIHVESDRKIAFTPTKEELEVLDSFKETAAGADLSDLRKALMQKLSPTNVYAPCSCGSGLKYKFCCANKLKNFDLERFIDENDTGGGAN